MKIKVDVSRRSAVGVCACGSRFLALSHERALERLAAHEQRAHPGDKHARQALIQFRKRHADTPASAA